MLNLSLAIQFSLWICSFIHLVSAIWPQPKELTTGNGVLWYSPNVTLHVTGYENCHVSDSAQHPLRTSASCKAASSYRLSKGDEEFLKLAFSDLKHDIEDTSFVPWKFHPPGSNFEPALDEDRVYLRSVRVYIADSISECDSPEAYQIDSDLSGAITVSSPTANGVRHAFGTLAQLFYRHSHGEIYSPRYHPLHIIDYPRFAHRGLNLDVSRNEISLQDVIRTLDTMRLTKLNKLHLHATDSQSWPLDISAIPELSRKGAYRADHTWSAEALKQVQEHAQSKGIELYLEIDMPGHTASIHHSHPDLIAGYDAPLANYSASEPPSGQLRLNSTLVPDFLHTLLKDLLPRITPYTTHFHLGGDELNTNIYALDPTVNSTDKSTLRPLLQSFYNTILSHLSSHNLTPIFWQEALLDWNLTLPSNSIIQLWRPSAKDLLSVLSRGHRALFGAASHWYLDCGFGTYLEHTRPSLEDFNDWCAPYKSWRHVYAYNPLADLPDNLQQESLLIGGEVHLWSELTDGVNLDGKLWPRAAAAAEVLWSGPKGVDGVEEDVTRRLAEWRERIVRRGVAAEMVQMTWCLMNKGGCAV